MQPPTLNAPEAYTALRKQADVTAGLRRAVPWVPGPARIAGSPKMYTLYALRHGDGKALVQTTPPTFWMSFNRCGDAPTTQHSDPVSSARAKEDVSKYSQTI